MRRTGFLPIIRLFLACAFAFVSVRAWSQTNDTNRPAPRPAQVTVRPVTQSNQGAPDLLGSLIANAASFDMDSPVEARAEFDPPTVSVGGEVSYRLTVTALDESLKVPDQLPVPPGLTLKPGGRAQKYEPIGGSKVRAETTIIFRGVASTNGTLTIPSFEVVAYSKPVKVPEATLKVTTDNVASTPEIPRLLMDLPVDDIYAGQTVRIPLILPVSAEGTTHGLSQPRVMGEFIFSEMPLIGMRQETIRRDGKTFAAYVQDVLVTPLREGDQEVVAQAYCSMLRPAPGQPGVLQNTMVLVDSGPVTLRARAVPVEGQLPGFTGAIGNFKIDPPRISTNEVRAGEPLILMLTVRGDGNIGRLTPPSPPLLRDWQVFPPISENLPAAIMQQRGFANFSYTLIPLNDQSKATPAIPFCCFDPKKKVFVDLTIPPVRVTVNRSPAGTRAPTEASTVPPANPEGEDANREREPVLSGLAEVPGGSTLVLAPMQQRAWFLGLQLAPALALAGLWAWDRRRRYIEEHPEVILRRRARRGLRQALQQARRAAAKQDAAGFVSGATDALREACAPSGAANPSALVCADVLEELLPPERDGQPGELVRRLFAAADALRFGGALKDGSDLLSLKPQFERLLDQMKVRL